jgi:YHS domain-containing protein
VPSQDFATDPVCGMRVDPTAAADTRQHKGTTYYFCSPWCGRKFDGDADAYLAASRLRGESDMEDAQDPHP